VLRGEELPGAGALITRDLLTEASQERKGLRILLAEDNAVNRKLAMRLLEKRGHSVAVATNGREALEQMEASSFDLVLMDVQMPEMDGLEATRRLRAGERGSDKRQAVVAMTALVMKGDRERCIAAGMDGYMSKPIRPQELDEILEKYAGTEGAAASGAGAASAAEESGASCVRTEELLERIGGDRAFLAELLELFRADSPGQIARAREAAARGDAAGLQHVAHSLKGALKNLAAGTASRLAEEIEAMGQRGETTGVEGRLAALEREVARVVTTLEAMCLVSAI
jgi:CheY-like chemotaxis protein